jgi:co-chaperonin GroES (HSP10)
MAMERKRPTIAELDKILNNPNPLQVVSNPDGSITTLDPKEWAIINESEALRAIDDRVLIIEDEFRSGLECSACNGKGHTDVICKHCNGTKFWKGNKSRGSCPDCEVGTLGARKSFGYEICDVCKGRSASVIVPDTSKRPSLTGRVISVGKNVTEFRVGDHVMYTNYTGIDFVVAGVRLRIMKQHDILCEHKQLAKKEKTPQSGAIREELLEAGINPLD